MLPSRGFFTVRIVDGGVSFLHLYTFYTGPLVCYILVRLFLLLCHFREHHTLIKLHTKFCGSHVVLICIKLEICRPRQHDSAAISV